MLLLQVASSSQGQGQHFCHFMKNTNKNRTQTRTWKQDVWSPQCEEENFSSTVFSAYRAFQCLAARQHFYCVQGSSFLWPLTNLACELGALQYCSSTSLANNRDGSSKWRTDLWATRFLSGWSFGRCGDDETKSRNNSAELLWIAAEERLPQEGLAQILDAVPRLIQVLVTSQGNDFQKSVFWLTRTHTTVWTAESAVELKKNRNISGEFNVKMETRTASYKEKLCRPQESFSE